MYQVHTHKDGQWDSTINIDTYMDVLAGIEALMNIGWNDAITVLHIEEEKVHHVYEYFLADGQWSTVVSIPNTNYLSIEVPA